jgi:hypothetical protein
MGVRFTLFRLTRPIARAGPEVLGPRPACPREDDGRAGTNLRGGLVFRGIGGDSIAVLARSSNGQGFDPGPPGDGACFARQEAATSGFPHFS